MIKCYKSLSLVKLSAIKPAIDLITVRFQIKRPYIRQCSPEIFNQLKTNANKLMKYILALIAATTQAVKLAEEDSWQTRVARIH